jgi:tetratricopeptide (TPR) repeat protein
VNDLNPGGNEPSRSAFLKTKALIAILVILIAGALIAFYLTSKTSDEVGAPLPASEVTATPLSLPIISNSAEVFQSPLSPLSPVAVSPTSNLADPDVLSQLFDTGLGYYEAKEYDKALEAFNKTLTLDPHYARGLDARGTVYNALGDPEKALADYNKAIETDPLYPPPYYNRGRLYSLQKKYDAAIADLQKSIELAPLFFGYRANGNIGLIYHQQGEYAKALEAFATAISFDDSKADTYYLRGESYTAMENYEAAISDYEAALSRFPNYNQAYQGLAYAAYKMGQFDQAQETLNKALEISANSPMTHFYLMLVYLATDQFDQAQAEVSQAMDSIGALSEEEQNLLFKRVLADLETFSQENPAKARVVEALVKLIPEP